MQDDYWHAGKGMSSIDQASLRNKLSRLYWQLNLINKIVKEICEKHALNNRVG